MKVGLIITVYKDIEALKVIIDSIRYQTILPDEVIIAEDNDAIEMKEYIKTINIEGVIIKHTFQEDKGWQKNKSLNNALKVVNSEYLIFIDGDCILNSRFIESHKSLAKKKTLLCGRRVDLGNKYSKMLRKFDISINELESNYIKKIFNILKDTRHYEEGLYFKANGVIYKALKYLLRKKTWLLGCHWSVWREDLIKINGFDEDFTTPLFGEDTDIERRLRGVGINVESCRNSAILYHLTHKKVFNELDYKESLSLMNSKENQFICLNGIRKLIKEQ